jgi:uncharacterized protein YacL
MGVLMGAIGGLLFSLFVLAVEKAFEKANFKSFNIATLGIFCGFLMGEAIMLVFNSSALHMPPEISAFFRIGTFLFAIYFGMTLAIKAAEQISISFPFLSKGSKGQKKKDLVLDCSILLDSRIIDLASSGLLDNHLIVPRFAVKELQLQAETGDDTNKAKARRALEVLKKLEAMPALEMQFNETDFSDLKDQMAKLLKLARTVDANVITSDINRIQQASVEGVKIINIHMLSNALKPITQAGESINIKIQRYGKEARQGVGYLDDGTMVVVNGGAEFIGETIRAQVLSVKHTSSGRMIFCNAMDESLMTEQEIEQSVADMENSHKNYFAL